MRILAVGCHPDDLEINCYGTLLRCIDQGDDVFVCNVANGSQGSMALEPKDSASVRLKEAQKAAELIGAKEYICMGVNDLEVDSRNWDTINAMIDVIRITRPDYIITHGGNDYQRDHNEVHDLVFNTSFMSSVPHYRTKHPCWEKIPSLYYMEPSSSNDFIPTDYVDITSTIDRKMEALACHESQVKWLMDHVGKDVLMTTRGTAIMRGRLCQTKYAETFRRCSDVLRMTASRLLP